MRSEGSAETGNRPLILMEPMRRDNARVAAPLCTREFLELWCLRESRESDLASGPRRLALPYRDATANVPFRWASHRLASAFGSVEASNPACGYPRCSWGVGSCSKSLVKAEPPLLLGMVSRPRSEQALCDSAV